MKAALLWLLRPYLSENAELVDIYKENIRDYYVVVRFVPSPLARWLGEDEYCMHYSGSYSSWRSTVSGYEAPYWLRERLCRWAWLHGRKGGAR